MLKLCLVFVGFWVDSECFESFKCAGKILLNSVKVVFSINLCILNGFLVLYVDSSHDVDLSLPDTCELGVDIVITLELELRESCFYGICNFGLILWSPRECDIEAQTNKQNCSTKMTPDVGSLIVTLTERSKYILD